MESPGINRREILKGIAGSALVGAFPEIVESQEKTEPTLQEESIDELRATVNKQFLDQVDKVFRLPSSESETDWGQKFYGLKQIEPAGSTYGFVDQDNRAVIVLEAVWNQTCEADYEVSNSELGHRIIVMTDTNGSDCKIVVHYWGELPHG